jgi:hypothetical protein
MRTDLLVQFLSGALVTAYAVAGLFFLRFWRESRDRLFAYFASSFFLLSIQRILIATSEPSAAIYVVRLLAFVLILWAIIDKNRSRV